MKRLLANFFRKQTIFQQFVEPFGAISDQLIMIFVDNKTMPREPCCLLIFCIFLGWDRGDWRMDIVEQFFHSFQRNNSSTNLEFQDRKFLWGTHKQSQKSCIRLGFASKCCSRLGGSRNCRKNLRFRLVCTYLATPISLRPRSHITRCVIEYGASFMS